MISTRTLRRTVAATLLGLAGATIAAPSNAGSYQLSGLWLFNEGAGQATKDWSSHGDNGQLGSTAGVDANDPTWVALPKIFLLKRAALRFDGQDFVRIPDAPALEPDGVTVVARLRSTGPGAYAYIASKGARACDNASYGLYTDRDGQLRFYASDGTSWTTSPAAAAGIWDGAWHTVVGSYDGANVKLTVDGVLVGQEPATFTIGYGLPDDDGFYIGDYAGPCASPVGFVGDIDGVAVIGSSAPADARIVAP